jgi:hypothetical protein
VSDEGNPEFLQLGDIDRHQLDSTDGPCAGAALTYEQSGKPDPGRKADARAHAEKALAAAETYGNPSAVANARNLLAKT